MRLIFGYRLDLFLFIIGQGYAQLVFSLKAKSIEEITFDQYEELCELQTLTESSTHYHRSCEMGCLCNSMSLVNYVAYLSSKHSCDDVTQNDLNQVIKLVSNCREYYSLLDSDCWSEEMDNFQTLKRCNISNECAEKSLYELYHFILSKPSEDENLLTISFLHMAQSKSTHELYLDIYEVIRQGRDSVNAKLISLEFGLKEYVFEQSLLTDTGWIGLALSIVVLIMCIYTESVFITFMTFVSMLFTIILSFTIYQFIFRIKYFPFLNLLAGIVVVGIGADDLFIYWKTWTAIKLGRNASILERIVTHTFQHASSAMFVTSASTATAFYASAYTDLISIRCFCLYAGTCVLVHYVLVITWLPACVVLYERYSLNLCYSSGKSSMLTKKIHHFYTSLVSFIHQLQERQTTVATLSYIWLPLFSAFSFTGLILLTVWPKFSAPSSHMFQMLSASHPFEVFDRDVKPRFDFTSNDDSSLATVFVFGVEPVFNGRYFDLASVGDLELKPLSNFGSEESQEWFSYFCWNLRQQPFYDSSFLQPSGCFIEELRSWLRFRSCDLHPDCCQSLTFPFNQSTFLHCLSAWSNETSRYQLSTMNPGVRYIDSQPALIIVSFWSNSKYSLKFNSMKSFYQNVSDFVDDIMLRCTLDQCESYRPMFTTAGGWLFYDVQNTLLDSLPLSLVVVLSASSFIIFLTTKNLLLTLCALISISFSILTTLGILSLMRWELNILESVIVSLTVGLSMDFPLHVAVAYRIASSTRDRKTRVSLSLRHVGGSLTAAMVTTLVAGICMLPSQVLAYTKLGTFLALVAVISWFYATFFMPALLVHIGPIGSFMQIDCKSCSQREKRKVSRSHEKTVYSEELSSDIAAVLSAAPSPSHLVLEPVIEESEEELSDIENEELNSITVSSTLLTSYNSSPSIKRLTPITEIDSDFSDSSQAL